MSRNRNEEQIVEKAFDKFRERLKERDRQDTHLQNRKRMTQDERSIGAVEVVAKNIKEFNEQNGREVTYEQARKEAVNIANQADRKAGK